MTARGVNKVIIVGNLGGDPEVRYMPNGNAVANFTVATSESWKDKHTGAQKDLTEWHRIVMYGRLAEIAGEYLRKGAKVYLEGRLKTRKWTGQDGQDRYTTEVIAGEMQMLDSRQGQGADRGHTSHQGYGEPQGSQQAPAGGQSGGNQGGYGSHKAGSFGGQHRQQQEPAPAPQDFDDDIPFDRFARNLWRVI